MYILVFVALLTMVGGKPVSDYTRLSIAEKIGQLTYFLLTNVNNTGYFFDTSGYFDSVSDEPFEGFRVCTKDNNTLIYDAGIPAFLKNKNTYLQCAPDFIRKYVVEDEIGLKFNFSLYKGHNMRDKSAQTEDFRVITKSSSKMRVRKVFEVLVLE